ncbi:hypothetical protein OY671_007429 [Metschnikowia pulcherrima]|nr:hypothetical protein OY671_007429 [Metschnikowia pulcherrima]
MDEFARRPADDRRAFFAEAAARRDLTPLIVEKDFWVCWTSRRSMSVPESAKVSTFKGGTSLSKAFGIIKRFSEDIDLTINRAVPRLGEVASPMANDISGKERERRGKALGAAAQEWVGTILSPTLAQAIEDASGTREGWSIEADPDDKDRQTVSFNYPASSGYGLDYGNTYGGRPGYVQPRIKLEFGARGDPEPFEQRDISPYVAEDFPGEVCDAVTAVPTLALERTYWEKATISHASHHSGKLRPGSSRHFYDVFMLDASGITERALTERVLSEQVVRNKSSLFADAKASYGTAQLGTSRLSVTDTMREELAADYAAMAEMFMEEPPGFDESVSRLSDIERRINAAG